MKPTFRIPTPRASAVAALLLAAPALHAATFVATGIYDEPVQTNAVDVTALGSNISLTAFTTLVGTAFTANRGGVIDFELPNGLATPLANISTFTASYGVGQANTLTVTSGSLAQYNTNTNNPVISGVNYLGISDGSATGGLSLRFSTPLEAFGITVLSRGVLQTISPTLRFADLTSLALAPFDVAAANTDTFLGYSSPSNPIIGVDLPSTGGSTFVRSDDLGFVAAVPEPTTMALGTFAGLTLLSGLRRRRA